MIKINLASRKQAVSAEGSRSSALPSFSSLGGGNLQDIKDLPIRKIVIHLICAIVAYYVVSSFKQDQIDIADKQLAALAATHQKLQRELDKSKGFEAKKKSLDDDLLILTTKLDTIKKLLGERVATAKVLVSVSKDIPKDVWLNEFKVTPSEVNIKGSSLGFNQISDFMKNLSDDIYFKEVNPKGNQQVKDASTGTDIYNFEFVAKRKAP